jgi:HTH-type transcriptional regulator/antitoxin HipB
MSQLARSPKQIGALIRRCRKAIGISQSELGDRAGIRQATISQIESGHPATKVATLFDVLSALNLDVEVVGRTRGGPADIESIF